MEKDTLARRIEIGILAQLAVHFLPLLLMVQQHVAVTQVLGLDLALSFTENVAHPLQVSTFLISQVAQSLRFLGPETRG